MFFLPVCAYGQVNYLFSKISFTGRPFLFGGSLAELAAKIKKSGAAGQLFIFFKSDYFLESIIAGGQFFTE